MTSMYKKPERYLQLEAKVWQNLNSFGILAEIIARSDHADELSNYVAVEFHDEFQFNTRLKEYGMWVQIYIKHQQMMQPVTPKIYRITNDADQQRQLCEQIWEGISKDDLIFIAKSSAEEYAAGGRWMDQSQTISMAKFLPAAQKGEVNLELSSRLAQYFIFARK